MRLVKEVDALLMALFGVMMRNLSRSFSGPSSEMEMSQVKGHLRWVVAGKSTQIPTTPS